jgi:hypothetical protein
VVHVHRKHWRIDRVDFFDKSQRLLKVRKNVDWHLRHGRFWRPRSTDMANEQTKKRTRIDVRNEFLNLSLYKSKRTGKARQNLTDRHFTTRAIEGS